MKARAHPRHHNEVQRLLVADRSGHLSDRTSNELPYILNPGDLLVLNDAAVFPGSIHAKTRNNEVLELRLAMQLGDKRWRAVLFGAGDWRTPTEHRPPPPHLELDDTLALDGGIRAKVVHISPLSPRLVELEMSAKSDVFFATLYALAKPVQYSYLARELSISETQNVYAARPWAAEPPSAGLSLTWSLLLALRKNGVRLARLTHAAGLSATGDDALDRALPLEEKYHLPERTVRAIEETPGRVIAVGTTVVRALEGNFATYGRLHPGDGSTALKLGPEHRLEVVRGVLTGVHEPSASHFALLEAFLPRALLEKASVHADHHGYLGHELGDAWLIC
jgi:S-adenosylmethionine:tRNA ribosyltransferase-isomerase